MKFSLLTVKSSEPSWLKSLESDYQKKINRFTSFEVKNLKASKLARKDQSHKKTKESEQLLKVIKPSDYVILLDERGKVFDSLGWSHELEKLKDDGAVGACVFVVGGAYGASQELFERANQVWSLSSLVMNHLLAEALVLEQFYRSVAIWNNLPYHNE